MRVETKKAILGFLVHILGCAIVIYLYVKMLTPPPSGYQVNLIHYFLSPDPTLLSGRQQMKFILGLILAAGGFVYWTKNRP